MNTELGKTQEISCPVIRTGTLVDDHIIRRNKSGNLLSYGVFLKRCPTSTAHCPYRNCLILSIVWDVDPTVQSTYGHTVILVTDAVQLYSGSLAMLSHRPV
jgi:hypothetical protein